MEALKCCICNKFLTVPPISLIRSDKELYKCGRCSKIRTQASTTVKLYEDLARYRTFKCSYQGCEDLLSWGSVAHHEESCPHRTIRCPIYYQNCFDDIKAAKIKEHFQTKHPTMVKTFRSNIKVTPEVDYVFLLTGSDGGTYLLYILHLYAINSVALFAVDGKKYKYIVKMIGPNARMIYEDRPVVAYDEREHCYRCFRRKCHEPHHLFSSKNEDGRMDLTCYATKMSRQFVTNAKNSCGWLSYNITLCNDESPNTSQALQSNLALEEGTVEGACVVDSLSHITNLKALKSSLTCPCCGKYFTGQLYNCEKGHTICQICKSKVRKCPNCSEVITDSRNYTLETLASEATVPCSFFVNGCTFTCKISKIYLHEENECAFNIE